MKRLLFLLIIFISFLPILFILKNPTATHAQGTYTCWWDNTDSNNSFCEAPLPICWLHPQPPQYCSNFNINCEEGYIPDQFDDCRQTADTRLECEAIKNCVLESEQPTPTSQQPPTSTPDPTHTPHPNIGTFTCRWDTSQSPECTIDDDNSNCWIEEGYMPCEETCEGFTTPEACENTNLNPITCMTPQQCYPDVFPTPTGMVEAQCAVDQDDPFTFTHYCVDDNPHCVEHVWQDDDGVWQCECRVPGFPGAICWRLGPGQFAGGLRLWCDIARNPVNYDDPNRTDRLYTAIGCIPITGGDGFTTFILSWAIGIAGGIALLLLVYAGIQIMTAAGNPEKVQAGKELLTSAIAGFLFLLFSVYLLEFIGVRILNIPGL